ncbi:hypothetical protein PoB_001237200 [Plakobranchus ocellatus]|uniref:Uncharacterized protein n=1 Tax=Plakobranchus ocellatus TaxID=259542 RepID=A0AAV3YUN5_9GAST|nr:hypothetical protein PoB_001237200 [Plakobranchus ocellatus]
MKPNNHQQSTKTIRYPYRMSTDGDAGDNISKVTRITIHGGYFVQKAGGMVSPETMGPRSLLAERLVPSWQTKGNSRQVLKTGIEGAVAHLVGQLATKLEVQGSNPSSGQVSFSMLLCVYPNG